MSGSHTGAVDGGVRNLLRAEGLLLLACSVALYWRCGGDWKQFAVLFLAPDLSFLGYAAGPLLGAVAYNSLHSTVGPLILGALGVALNVQPMTMLALIWIAHVGFDRALGYGLKHDRGFGFTHLGRIGRNAKES